MHWEIDLTYSSFKYCWKGFTEAFILLHIYEVKHRCLVPVHLVTVQWGLGQDFMHAGCVFFLHQNHPSLSWWFTHRSTVVFPQRVKAEHCSKGRIVLHRNFKRTDTWCYAQIQLSPKHSLFGRWDHSVSCSDKIKQIAQRLACEREPVDDLVQSGSVQIWFGR